MYTVYKILNLKTNQYYIGVHKTENPNDSYLGSGIHITRQVKLYGKDAFKKEILFIFNDQDSAYEKEKELISIHKKDKFCLNIGEGGIGGDTFSGRKHTEETKKLISCKMKGKKYSLERRKQISESLKGRVFSEETRLKISEAMKERYKKLKVNKVACEESRLKISDSLKRYWDKKGRKNPRRTYRKPVCKITTKEKVWVFKDNISYHIYKDELDFYLDSGWKRGRGNKLCKIMSKSLKGKHKGKENSVFGTKWMYNETTKEIAMIKKELVQDYLKKGWKLGNKNKDPKFKRCKNK